MEFDTVVETLHHIVTDEDEAYDLYAEYRDVSDDKLAISLIHNGIAICRA